MSKTITPVDIDIGAELSGPGPPGVIGRLWARALGRALRLSLDETRVDRRGFQVDSLQVAQRLEQIGANFVHGLNNATRCASLDELVSALEQSAPADAGFAFEGAAMGLALTDWMTPGRRRFEAFVAGPASRHEYMAWVGLGWALARLPVSPLRALKPYRSINKWLALDGLGFHEGYFNARRSIRLRIRPRSLDAGAARIFDQGLGRSMWFVFGARTRPIAAAIAAFGTEQYQDLWSGVGLGAAYAGGVDESGLKDLRAAAGSCAAALGQGVVFAAEARCRAGNPVEHSALACEVIAGLSLPEAAQLARDCLPSHGDDIKSYQQWQASIRNAL